MSFTPNLISTRVVLPGLLSLLLCACAPGPESHSELAKQGLLSGDLSNDGSLAVIGSVLHGGSLWDTQSNERLFSWNHQSGQFSSFRTVEISGNKKIAVTTQEQAIGVWDTQSGESLGFWEANDRILAIALSHDGSKALMGLRNGKVEFFDLRSGQVLQSMTHDAEVRAVGLSVEADIGISGSDDFSARTWRLSSGEELSRLSLNNQIKTVGLSPRGNIAFTSAQRDGAIFWNPESGEQLAALESRYTNYTSLVFKDDETSVYLGTSSGQIEHWDIQTLSKLGNWQLQEKKLFGRNTSKAVVSISAGEPLTALSSDGQIQTFR